MARGLLKQFHFEIKDTTVNEWGWVPEYKKALEHQLGVGALEKFNQSAKNYKTYSLKILKVCKKKPISFEVFGDTFNEMLRQAMVINSWGK